MQRSPAMKSNEPQRKTLQRWNREGDDHFLTFSCFRRQPLLSNEKWRTMLGTDLRAACDDLDIALLAYVFMPEHVHLVVRLRQKRYSISEFLSAFKKPVGRTILASLRKNGSPLLEKLRTQSAATIRHRFWQPGGGYDLNIWTSKKLHEKIEYCHWNPVKRGLVKSPEQWRWSSYRWIVLGKREGEPIRIDA